MNNYCNRGRIRDCLGEASSVFLENLGMTRVVAKFVQRYLSSIQKNARVQVCSDMRKTRQSDTNFFFQHGWKPECTKDFFYKFLKDSVNADLLNFRISENPTSLIRRL